jgi:hypothetical protein
VHRVCRRCHTYISENMTRRSSKIFNLILNLLRRLNGVTTLVKMWRQIIRFSFSNSCQCFYWWCHDSVYHTRKFGRIWRHCGNIQAYIPLYIRFLTRHNVNYSNLISLNLPRHSGFISAMSFKSNMKRANLRNAKWTRYC